MYLGQQPHIAKASGLPDDLLGAPEQVIGAWPPRLDGIEAAMGLVGDDVVDRMAVAGTPDECRRRIWDWVEGGASYPIIVPLTDNYDEIVEAFTPANLERPEHLKALAC